MSKLLDLVPRFRQAMETRVQAPRQTIPSLLTDTSSGPTIVDHRSPAIKVLIHGTEIQGCVVDGGSGVNVISKATCQTLGITTWENCPFWLRMADTRSVRPLGLLRKLPIIIGGHSFEISAVVLALESPGAYPVLLGRPWLRAASVKQNWHHNNLSFRRGRSKVRVPMEESRTVAKDVSPLYAEEIHMLEGLDDEELEQYLEENPRIVPLFEIDVRGTAESYTIPNTSPGHEEELGENALAELQRAQEAFDREMEVSRRVVATELEEVNMGTPEEPRTLSIARNLSPSTKTSLIRLLSEYRDVFAWSYDDMKGLDPKFYQHQINLAKDAKPVQQR